MQDSAPVHYAIVVRERLDEHFSSRWLDRRGPHEWPPRSPVITPYDFFLCGRVNTEVYKTRPRKLNTLKDSIKHVISNISQQVLLDAMAAVPKRLNCPRSRRFVTFHVLLRLGRPKRAPTCSTRTAISRQPLVRFKHFKRQTPSYKSRFP